MKPDHRNTLVLPFEAGEIAWPDSQMPWVFFNAQPLPDANGIGNALECEQAFRPDFLQLEKAGYQVVPQIDHGKTFHGAMILLGRVRMQNELAFERAWRQTRPGSVIVVCGSKTSGIQSFRKWVSELQPIEGSLSKHHAVAFWCIRQETPIRMQHDTIDQGYLFSGGTPDKGSMLLASCFDKRIKGKVADIGSGWGYLTGELLKSCDRVTHVDLYEADWHSLEQAKSGLAKVADERRVELAFHWVDVISEFNKKPFEWVVMNPPFHHGLGASRSGNADIGKAFIQAAGSTLIQGGRLLMVANRGLPYEETLDKVFRRFEKIADAGGYKVFEAVK